MNVRHRDRSRSSRRKEHKRKYEKKDRCEEITSNDDFTTTDDEDLSFDTQIMNLKTGHKIIPNRSIGTPECRYFESKAKICSYIIRHVKVGRQRASSILGEQWGSEQEKEQKQRRSELPPGFDAPYAEVCRLLDSMTPHIPLGSRVSSDAPELHGHQKLDNSLFRGITSYDILLKMASLETGVKTVSKEVKQTNLEDILPIESLTFLYEYTWKDVSAFSCTSRIAAWEMYRRQLCEEDGYGDHFLVKFSPIVDILQRKCTLDLEQIKRCEKLLSDEVGKDNTKLMRSAAVTLAWRKSAWCPVCLRLAKLNAMPDQIPECRTTRSGTLSPLPMIDELYCPYHVNSMDCTSDAFPFESTMRDTMKPRAKLVDLACTQGSYLMEEITKAVREAEERSKPRQSIFRSGRLLCNEYFCLQGELQRLIQLGMHSRYSFLEEISNVFLYAEKFKRVLELTAIRKKRPRPHLIHRRCQNVDDDGIRPELNFPLALLPEKGQEAVDKYQDEWFFTKVTSGRTILTSTLKKRKAAADYSRVGQCVSILRPVSRIPSLKFPSYRGGFTWNDVDTSSFPGQSYRPIPSDDIDKDVQSRIEETTSNHLPSGPSISYLGKTCNDFVKKVSGITIDPRNGNILGKPIKDRNCAKCSHSLDSCTCNRPTLKNVRPILLNSDCVPSSIQTAKAWREKVSDKDICFENDLIYWFPKGTENWRIPEVPNLNGECALFELQESIKTKWQNMSWIKETDDISPSNVVNFVAKHNSTWYRFNIQNHGITSTKLEVYNANNVKTEILEKSNFFATRNENIIFLTLGCLTAVLTSAKNKADSQQRFTCKDNNTRKGLFLKNDDRLYQRKDDNTFVDIVNGSEKPSDIKVEPIGEQTIAKRAEIRQLIGSTGKISDIFAQVSFECALQKNKNSHEFIQNDVLSHFQPTACDCLVAFTSPTVIARITADTELEEESMKRVHDRQNTERGIKVPRLQMANFECPRCQTLSWRGNSYCSRCSAKMRAATCRICCRPFGLLIVSTAKDETLETILCSNCHSVLGLKSANNYDEHPKPESGFVNLYFDCVKDRTYLFQIVARLQHETACEIRPFWFDNHCGITVRKEQEHIIGKFLSRTDMKGYGSTSEITVQGIETTREHKTLKHLTDIIEVRKNLGPMQAVDKTNRLTTLVSLGHLASKFQNPPKSDIKFGEITLDMR